MLNTDRHNPMVKNKMELDDFLRNNRGINGDGGDLPPEMLSEIFHDIVNSEIKLKDDAEDWSKHSSMLSAKKRQEMWQAEVDNIVKKSTDMFKADDSRRLFAHADESAHVRLMFKASWCPLLAAFSVIMESSNDEQMVRLCLKGIRHAVHIGAIFFMDLERNAFVSTVAKLTLLQPDQRDKEMLPKHIDAVKTVLQIAYSEGNCLEDSWGLIQRAISQLDRKQLLLEGARDDASFFATGQQQGGKDTSRNAAGAAASGSSSWSGAPGEAVDPARVEFFNSRALMDQVERNSIDRVYANSSNLNSEAIIHFVTHLCEVSAEELKGAEPRIFSLQKIVESASVNMGRVRIVWGRIWKILQAHFSLAGCHANSNIAMFAIDSLRQLAYKFLEKEELSNFNFQTEFLLPFEHIVSHSKSVQIRELVVCCLDQMIQGRAKNLKYVAESLPTYCARACAPGSVLLLSASMFS